MVDRLLQAGREPGLLLKLSLILSHYPVFKVQPVRVRLGHNAYYTLTGAPMSISFCAPSTSYLYPIKTQLVQRKGGPPCGPPVTYNYCTDVLLTDLEHLGSTDRACPLCSRSSVLHRDPRRVLHLPLGLALDAVGLH